MPANSFAFVLAGSGESRQGKIPALGLRQGRIPALGLRYSCAGGQGAAAHTGCDSAPARMVQ